MLDLTVLDLMSIVHMDNPWVENANYYEMRTSGGRGWPGMRGDHKRANFCRHLLWMAPYSILGHADYERSCNELLFYLISHIFQTSNNN